jgi:hypothetical protein
VAAQHLQAGAGIPARTVAGWRRTGLAGGDVLVLDEASLANRCFCVSALKTTGRPQRLDAHALAADAEARGWIEEADRHRRLIDRLDAVLAQAANT